MAEEEPYHRKRYARRKAQRKARQAERKASIDPLKGRRRAYVGLIPEELIDVEYRADFLSEEEEFEILKIHERQVSSTQIRRATRHYGYDFDYATRTPRIREDSVCPDWAHRLFDRLDMPMYGRQVTVNRYLPGEGIAPHVDTHSVFGEHIVTISLGSSIVMELAEWGDTAKIFSIVLERRSCLLMKGVSRYNFSHGIKSRKTDVIDDEIVARKTRWSVTLRNVKSAPSCECEFPKACDFADNHRVAERVLPLA